MQQRVKATIEDARIHKVRELYARKPKGLKLNETEALVVTARTESGQTASKTFFFCMKPDGTFDPHTIGADGPRSRRNRLAAFMRYYGLSDELKGYNIRERIAEWKGRGVEAISGEGIIYVP
jgi:hypothetical protein